MDKMKQIQLWFLTVLLACTFIYAYFGITLFLGYTSKARPPTKPATYTTPIRHVHVIGSCPLKRLLVQHLSSLDVQMSAPVPSTPSPSPRVYDDEGDRFATTNTSTVDPFSAIAAMSVQRAMPRDASHVLLVPADLDSVYLPSLSLVNTLEAMRSLGDARALILLPHSRADSVVGRTLEYISLVYHSVYGLNSTVIYTPDQYMDPHRYSPAMDNSSEQLLSELTQVFRVDDLGEKYVFSPEKTTTTTIMPGTQAADNDTASSNQNATEMKSNASTANPGVPIPPLPLDLCLSSTMSVTECLNRIHQEQTLSGRFVAHTEREHYIFTTYFSSKTDPQRGKKQASNNFNYVQRWFMSLRHLGLKAVVFHDGLEAEFIASLQTAHPGKIFFEKVTNFGKLSTNDFRFQAYYDYLVRNPRIEKILCTDVSDVIFHRDPFELMTLLGDHLYVGQDNPYTKNMGENGWLKNVAKKCSADSALPHYKHISTYYYFLNAGVIGGSRSTMMRFLEKTNKYLATTTGSNCNMLVVNYVAQRFFRHAFFTGSPLTGVFKGYRFYMSVYISHKGEK